MKKKFLFFISVFTFLFVFGVSASAAPSGYFSGSVAVVDEIDSIYVVPQGYYLSGSLEYPVNYGVSPKFRVDSVSELVFDVSNFSSSSISYLKLEFTNGTDTFRFSVGCSAPSSFFVLSENYEFPFAEYKFSSDEKFFAFNLLSLIEASSENISSFPFSSENLPTFFSVSLGNSSANEYYVYCVIPSVSFGDSSGGSCTQTHITDTDGDGYDDSSYNAGATVGYNNGYDAGHDTGYDIGYEAGQLSLGSDENGDGYLDEPYNAGYDAGTKDSESYSVGFEDGKDWQHNYDLSTGAVSDFVTDVGGSIISAFLYTGSNIQILGISLLSILGIIVVGIFAFWVFRKVKGN